MEEKRRFKAKINEKKYTIIGQKSAQHLNAVVDIVNQQLEQLASIDESLSVADRSILMAINAVSNQLSQEQRILDLEAQLADYSLDKQRDQQTSLFNSDIEDQNPRVPFERE